MLLFFFFFSSRRRHTRSLCDWSSDVCSSDLDRLTQEPRALHAHAHHPEPHGVAGRDAPGAQRRWREGRAHGGAAQLQKFTAGPGRVHGDFPLSRVWGVVSAITGAVVARLAWCDPLPPARLFTAGRNREAIRLNRIALSGFTGRASSSMGTTPSGGAPGIGCPSFPNITSS